MRGIQSRAFLWLAEAAIIAYNGKEPVKLGKRLWALPLGLVLS